MVKGYAKARSKLLLFKIFEKCPQRSEEGWAVALRLNVEIKSKKACGLGY
jgi:hypothetical protein